MSNRRPLANVPGAINSPCRSTGAATSKRSRLEFDAKEHSASIQPPPAKRQLFETYQSRLRTPPRRQTPQPAEDRVFSKRPDNSQPTAFERKLLAAKDRPQSYKTEAPEKPTAASLDGIRQWQRHYRRVFPDFVFYFESIPEDVRVKYSKFVRILGAKEEKFFSKEVTHVITSRAVPAERESSSPTENVPPAFSSSQFHGSGQTRTINPAFLERTAETLSQQTQPRSKVTSEKPLGRKSLMSSLRDSESRRYNASQVDILSKAKEMGMKIWQLEKLQRITNSMFDAPTESKSQYGRNSRSLAGLRDEREADLSRMLRNEQLNGPSDRDSIAANMEFIPFKGPYIYIRDMDERTKPIMVKEYPKVSHNDKGEWPQFRSVSAGKCPFVQEAPSRSEHEKTKTREGDRDPEGRSQSPSKTRTATAIERGQVPPKISAVKMKPSEPLHEILNESKRLKSSFEKRPEQVFCAPPTTVPIGRRSPLKGLKHLSAILGGPRTFGGEPAASGLQPSNVTSAIQSQMISSTAAAPGAKAGTSREFQGLKRKVLERNSGPTINNSHIPSIISGPSGSLRPGRSAVVTRQTSAMTQEKLNNIDEESTEPEVDEEVWRAGEVRKIEKPIQKRLEKRDRKPGYCENCRDKYDDFDQHIVGRTHKTFARMKENWRDLDKLLVQLGRRLKEEPSEEGLHLPFGSADSPL
ncbi:hypothetical protein MMC07_002476 [Pseudocyphellaria aurata]|nr:hypothetical protein [Pseudocyphellaria aurata]